MNKHWRKGLITVTAFSAAASWWMVGCGGDDAFVASATDAGTHTDATAGDTGTGQTDGATTHDGATDGATDANSTTDASDAGNLAISIPASAPYDQWTWIPVAGAVCADGSMTGMGVNPHQGSTTLTVYFEGGGACWNDQTCQAYPGNGGNALASNLDGYGATEFADGGTLASYGIFQRTSNPLATENFVYIPYCTGDIHAGSNDATYNSLNDAGAGGDAGTFVIHHQGFTNAGLDLDVIKATFPDTSRLVVTGSSAGGYGSFFNYERFHQGFPTVQAYLIDDSGPPLPNDVAQYTAQDARWHHFANIPADCPACSPADGGAFMNMYPYLTSQDPKFRGSLFETDHDEVISAFFSSNGAYGPLVMGDENNATCVTGFLTDGTCDFTGDLQTVYDKLAASNVANGGQLRAHIEHDVFHTYLGGASTYAKVAPFIASQLGLDGGVDGGWVDDTPYPHP